MPYICQENLEKEVDKAINSIVLLVIGSILLFQPPSFVEDLDSKLHRKSYLRSYRNIRR